MKIKILRKKDIVRKIYKEKIMTHCYKNGDIIQYLFCDSKWYKLPSLKQCKISLKIKLSDERRVMLDTYCDTNKSFDILLNFIPKDIIDLYIRKTKIDKIIQKVKK